MDGVGLIQVSEVLLHTLQCMFIKIVIWWKTNHLKSFPMTLRLYMEIELHYISPTDTTHNLF